jgi:hypothetical protein
MTSGAGGTHASHAYISHVVRVLAFVIACALACSPAGRQQLQILSKGGTVVAVVIINGSEVARVACNGGAVIRPREEVRQPVVHQVPPLPWDLRVFDQVAGQAMLNERVTELPRWLVIFRDSAGISSAPVLGPFASCAEP